MWQMEMDGQILEEEETACTKYDDMRVLKVHKDCEFFGWQCWSFKHKLDIVGSECGPVSGNSQL